MQDLFVPTLNNQGYAAVKLDQFSERFTEYSEGQYLEIGAAYGYAAIEALKNGVDFIANDLDKRHLQHLEKEANRLGYTNLTIIAGEFPAALNFKPKSFRKILLSRVLHFFSGKEIKQALQTLYEWLEPEGELYVTCETTFLGNWTSFIPEYQKRIEQGIAYPGEIDNPSQWENTYSHNFSQFIHFLDKDVLSRLFEEAGLEIIEVKYINRSGQFPEDLLLDGRESVGIIGKRPK